MTPRINVAKGITGAINYARGEGRDPITSELKKLAAGQKSRVEWFGGAGFGFAIDSEARVELARKRMEFDALNQKGHCRLDVVHLSLSWRPGENPTREEQEAAVASAFAAIGMANAKYVMFGHGDERYCHVHAIGSKINPATGYAYDLKEDHLKLSVWAQEYEAAHGGIVSVRRVTNNELRDAIKRRDAGAVLEALTRQRSTFTPGQLENALFKQIKNQSERVAFAGQILSHADIVQLADRHPRLCGEGGSVKTRYTTRAVYEAELYIRSAAESLKLDTTHGLDDCQRAAVLKTDQFRAMTDEQARVFRHATGPDGLVLIDGQAGTGKSYTIAAVRQAYEAAGCKIIGLGPTNPVAEDMKADGFGHASTIHSELGALNRGHQQWDAKTVVIVDEAAMIDTKLMALVTAHAAEARAKLILVGDDRQLSSIDRGGMFGALKDCYGAAALSEVKRQYKADEKRASEMLAEGNFDHGLHIYDAKGAIHWTSTQREAGEQLIQQWAQDSAAGPDKTRFVLAYTNELVDWLNLALRDIRKSRGELGADHQIDTEHGPLPFSIGDRLQFTGTDKKQGIHNSRAGTIEAIDGTHIAVRMDGLGHHARTIAFDAASFDKFRHGYAGTVYKAQGKSIDQTYLFHSEHWRRAASYVALTRHREKTALFVARNVAKDITELARQMARPDERRAASQFEIVGPEITVEPLTPAEILARFAAEAMPKKGPDNPATGEAGKNYSKHDERRVKRAYVKQSTYGPATAANQNDAPSTTSHPSAREVRIPEPPPVNNPQRLRATAPSIARKQREALAAQRVTSLAPPQRHPGRYNALKDRPSPHPCAEARQTQEPLSAPWASEASAMPTGEPQRGAEPAISPEMTHAAAKLDADPCDAIDCAAAKSRRHFHEAISDGIANASHFPGDTIVSTPPPVPEAREKLQASAADGNLEAQAAEIAAAVEHETAATHDRKQHTVRCEADPGFAEGFDLPTTSQARLSRAAGAGREEDLQPDRLSDAPTRASVTKWAQLSLQPKPNASIAEPIKGLFRKAARAATTSGDGLKVKARRRRGDTKGEELRKPAHARASDRGKSPGSPGQVAARGRYTALWRADEDDWKTGEIAADFAGMAKAICEGLLSAGLEVLGKMFEDLGAAFSGEHDGANFSWSEINLSGTLDPMNPFPPVDAFSAESGADFVPPQNHHSPHL